jgi:hypothetical protein
MGRRTEWKRGGVTVWEEWKCEIDGKNVSEGTLCHNPGKKKGGRFVIAT